MIESLMLFALGFLIATLFAIIASQFIWRRAVTVTTRNLAGIDPAGEEHDALRELLDDRNARLSELSTRLEKLEASEVSAPNADETDERQHRAEAEAADAAREAERLRTRLSEMETELARSRAERRQAQDGQLAALNRRIADFEAALTEDAHRQEQSRASLRSIGERAARLAYDLNNIIEEIAPRSEAREEHRQDSPERSGEKPGDGQPDETGDEDVADTLEELTDRVQAAYGPASGGPSAAASIPASAGETKDEGEDDEGLEDEPRASDEPAGKPGGSPLDERIRALEAGLPH
ncbi:Skp family chaperone for outer membrane proteins [Parvibaculum indicum]|uniref:hypothetical protein n=1 Tax=Parvibaculum indicum TaxID=562969 RepID=UPI001422A228|nr:hypothetical protein [Parvibaculum indicum]NIJ40428.1 Skp family chaperone for outer membrane proteins [Parvibaculum indicum]